MWKAWKATERLKPAGCHPEPFDRLRVNPEPRGSKSKDLKEIAPALASRGFLCLCKNFHQVFGSTQNIRRADAVSIAGIFEDAKSFKFSVTM